MARVLFFYKFYYILNVTIQSIAQSIQGFGAYCLSSFYSVKGICRKALLKYQIIFCYSFFIQRFIKRFVRYHFHHRLYFTILNLLTILNILSIIIYIILSKEDFCKRENKFFHFCFLKLGYFFRKIVKKLLKLPKTCDIIVT